MSHHGISVHPDSAAVKSKELGKNHDSTVKTWMKSITESELVQTCLDDLDASVQELNYLPELPSHRHFASLLTSHSSHQETMKTTANSQHEVVQTMSQTVDMSRLNLSCHNDPLSLAENIVETVKTHGNKDQTVMKAVEYSVAAGNQLEQEGSANLHEAIQKAKTLASNESTLGFQVIGDNLDLHLSVRHMSKSNQNKSLHTFNMVAMKDKVSGRHLPDVNQRSLSSVEISEFLPSEDEVCVINFIVTMN
jgi:hypothetical protein